MPSRSNSTNVKPTGTVASKRFELPVLDFKFASLTDGTDIPPPVPEAAVPTPPETPKAEDEKRAGQPKSITTNGKSDLSSPKTSGSIASPGGTKRPADDGPSSPTLSSRPGSIRRLFSRNLLHNAYANGEEVAAIPEAGTRSRPPSRSTTAPSELKKQKRSSGWFSRFRSSDSASTKRSSTPLSPTNPTIMEEKKPVVKGPPPPMIPELSELKSKVDVKDDGGFGDDLFKDIK
ncbi:hypothetical protein B0T22DRAFT_374002 [Podospora appendiculata]|uniref:Uncharacterized protein n=1 Tax=Podospora appendiculata TaxID=314037 RepID=A0AAE1CHN6_9PEZI|nr:hypothetical protein B0T22DRAFT_374002 [Podospora appendiculata]